MNLFSGLRYNVKGLLLGFKTPGLLFWGMIRFFITIGLTIIAAGLALYYHNDILMLLWDKPQSTWIVWLWYLLSWLLTMLLIGLSAVLSYLFSQILFSIWIMDKMARITEHVVAGKESHIPPSSFWSQIIFLISQELPRTIAPVLITLFVMVLGLFTPIGPVIAVVGPAATIIFLAWDNTDLIPARQLLPFKKRFSMLLQTLPFHIGFGLPFLIPVANILFLSFAPVGATLYHLEKRSADGQS